MGLAGAAVFLVGVWVLCNLVSERRGCVRFLTWVCFGMLVMGMIWAFSSGFLRV